MKKILLTLITCTIAAFICVAAQCIATTKKGTQCKRQASPNSSYCWQHGGTARAQRAVNVIAAESVESNALSIAKEPLCIKEFQGVPFGSAYQDVKGFPVKESERKTYQKKYHCAADKIKTVSFSRPFACFRKGVALFDQNDKCNEVITECCYPHSKKKTDIMAEMEKVKDLLDGTYSIKLKGESFTPPRVRNRLTSMGLGSGVGPREDTIGYYDKNTRISLSCEKYMVENHALRGPGVPDSVEAYKLVLSISSRWYLKANWQHTGQTESGAKSAPVATAEKTATETTTPATAERTQCTATTKSGKRCSRKAQPGSDKCWQHQ